MKGRVEYEGCQDVTIELDGEEREYCVDFTAEVDCWYTPAKVSGPPEKCCPEDSETELVSLKIDLITNTEGDEINAEEVVALCRKGLNEDEICEAAFEQFMEGA